MLRFCAFLCVCVCVWCVCAQECVLVYMCISVSRPEANKRYFLRQGLSLSPELIDLARQVVNHKPQPWESSHSPARAFHVAARIQAQILKLAWQTLLSPAPNWDVLVPQLLILRSASCPAPSMRFVTELCP